MEALKALNSFESSVELFVHALNEIRGSRTVDVEDSFGLHVGGELLAAREDVLHGGDFHGIVVVTRRAPANAGLESISSEVFDLEDVFFEVSEETTIGFLAAYPERSPDVLKEVHVADLDNAAGEDILRRHADGIVLVASNTPERISRVLQFCEELHECFKVLRGGEETDGNVVRDVVHAIDERNLLRIALHCNVLPIDDQRAPEAFPVAVPGRDVVVMRKSFQFSYKLPVGASDASPFTMSKRADARPLYVQ